MQISHLAELDANDARTLGNGLPNALILLLRQGLVAFGRLHFLATGANGTHTAQFVGTARRAMLAAVGGSDLTVCLFALAQKELLAHAAINNVPRQNLILAKLAVGIKGRINARALKYAEPLIIVEILIPSVKRKTFLASKLKGIGKAAVSAREDCLNARDLCIVMHVSDVLVFDLRFEIFLLFGKHLHRILCLPLEGGKGLGNKARNAHRYLHGACFVTVGVLVVSIHHVLGKGSNALNILKRLGGQTVHKIELYRVFACIKRHVDRAHNIFLTHILVDNVAQSLRARLGGKGKRRRAHRLDAAHQILVKAINTE